MSALTGETHVFSAREAGGRCVVMFIARRQGGWWRHCDATTRRLAAWSAIADASSSAGAKRVGR